MKLKGDRGDFRSQSEWIMIICFLTVLLVPAVPMLFHRAAQPDSQSGANGDTPAVIVAYERFKGQLELSFAFRMALVHFNTRFKTDWLGVSPSLRVAFGSHGWLFYKDENEVLCSKHAAFSERQLTRWTNVIEGNSEYCRKKGIHYVLVITPDKHTIYPEYLPESLRPVVPKSRMDQLLDRLNGRWHCGCGRPQAGAD